MAERSGPIYQLRLIVDHEHAGEVDAWLEGHVRESQHNSVVLDCNAFGLSIDSAQRTGRVCQYTLASDAALDDYLETVAPQVETDLSQQFGDAIEISDRVLREDHPHEMSSGGASTCLNCGTHLRGQYCGHCGQRSRNRLISLWELVSEAFGDLFELDSRLWRTLVPLVTRPGQLTYDYLQGRRARFMPPFRMYLVLSLVFFVVAFFNPREELSLFFEAPAIGENTEPADAPQISDSSPVVEDNDRILKFGNDDADASDDDGSDCDNIEPSDLNDMPVFLARRLTAERLRQICLQVDADQGKSLTEKAISNVPTALIVLLPLMALVLKALYPLSRRYYVEHLLFFVHFHAFLFLLLTALILFVRLSNGLAIPELPVTLVVVAASLYATMYLFVAMRRVYGQGRFVTFLKYIVLTIAYIIGIISIMALTFTLAAFSI